MKKITSVILSLIIVICNIYFIDFSAYSETLSSTGSCGENVTYTFDSTTGELVISGFGEMYNYIYHSSPFYNNLQIKSVSISDGVTSLGNCCFYNCSKITKVNISNTVKSIGVEAFRGCIELREILIPEGVLTLGEYSFCECSSLELVSIPSSLVKVDDNAFYECNNLKRIDTKSIESWCNITFYDKYANPLSYAGNLYIDGELLTNLEIPNGITSINPDAFYGCTSITSLFIPSSVKKIEYEAFYACINLKELFICDGLEYISNYSFYKCNSLENVKIPNSVKKIGAYCFGLCASLKEIKLSNNLSIIESGCFSRCSNLTRVVIPNGVTIIKPSAFYLCIQLSCVLLPDTITEIEDFAFFDDYALNTVYYTGNLEQWEKLDKGNNTYLNNATLILHKHEYVITETVSSTCIKQGYAKYICDCGSEYLEILKMHRLVLLDCIPTTCFDDGLYIYECTECGEMYTEEIKATGHSSLELVVENRVNPTCSQDGSYDEVVYCERCSEELSRTPKTIDKLGHSFSDVHIENSVESTCINKGSYDEVTYCTTCGIELSRNTITTNELGHNIVYDEGITVTCTTDGLTQGYHCIRCNEVLIKQEVIPALNHNYVITDSQAPVCTIDGYNVYTCSNCNDSYTEIIEKIGHTNYLYRTTASCEKAGYDVYKCSVCSTLTSVKVDALGHICDLFNGVVDNELSYYCSRCSKNYTMSVNSVFGMWDSSIINKSAGECPELDVVDDGIINAKDYAKLNHIKNFGY